MWIRLASLSLLLTGAWWTFATPRNVWYQVPTSGQSEFDAWVDHHCPRATAHCVQGWHLVWGGLLVCTSLTTVGLAAMSYAVHKKWAGYDTAVVYHLARYLTLAHLFLVLFLYMLIVVPDCVPAGLATTTHMDDGYAVCTLEASRPADRARVHLWMNAMDAWRRSLYDFSETQTMLVVYAAYAKRVDYGVAHTGSVVSLAIGVALAIVDLCVIDTK
jgi:hypothetical protein